MSEKPENEDQLTADLRLDDEPLTEDELQTKAMTQLPDEDEEPDSGDEAPEEPGQTELLPLVGSAVTADEASKAVDVPVIEAGSPVEQPTQGTFTDNEASADNGDGEGGKSHALRNGLVALVTVVVFILAGFSGWLIYDDSQNASCHVPQGVTLDGADMSGRSKAEVASLVKKNIREGLTGDTVLHVGDDKEYRFNIAQMGSIDVDATVDAVMDTIEPNMAARCVNKALSLFVACPAPEPRALTTVCSLNKKKVKDRVQGIADELDSDARDAGYTFDATEREVETVTAKTGYKVNVNKTTKAVLNASKRGEASVEAVATVTKPTKTELGQAIYVDLNECHLYFYVDGKVKRDYPCTPGKSGYSTPSGTWYLEYKDSAPVWINPHSDWSKDMPETIQPGETNPLGLRALAVSCGGGIYIHGTTNTGELGTKASHGCVRLANANVVELFDLVETGIPIFIY